MLVECRWLPRLSQTTEIAEVPAFDDSACRLLDELSTKLSLSVAQEVIMKEVRCCCVDCVEADLPYMLHAGA